MNAKKFNQLLIALLLVVTSTSLTGAGFIVTNNYDMFWKTIISDSNNVKIGTPLENCKSVADRLNMPVNVVGQNMHIKRFEINNPEMLFSKVSAMVMACTQYRLESMCVGTECPQAQFSAVLAKIE